MSSAKAGVGRDQCDRQSWTFRTEGLNKVYETGATQVHALRGVDLDVPEGAFVVLLGPSGSGKSTLLNILGGLDRPTAGSALFGDLDLATAGDTELTRYRRDHVGFIFQFYNLVPSLTARENVALVTEIATDPMAPHEALELVGLGGRLDHFPSQLSGGEQQRVALARAFAPQPDLLLADEPTGNLDGDTGGQVIDLLFDLQARHGTTLLLITHDTGLAARCARTVRLRDGHIVDDGSSAPVSAVAQ